MGQVDLEGRAAPWLARDSDVSATLLDDPIHRRQAQPRSLANVFRREEWLEDASGVCLVHTIACVAHGEHHVVARRNGKVPLLIVLVQRDMRRLDGELAA